MHKVLIANRGEIAVRIIRACRDYELVSVAIYADADRDAPHSTMADEAYALGGESAADSYLRIDKILDVARKSGADAVHPGYGFLAENAEFAQAVLDAGLIWIGPSPTTIGMLGDKAQARQLALAAGAPLVPGTTEPVSGEDEVLAFAREHGLPIAIKAVFGGGGRGLKVVETFEELDELYASAVREAEGAFGRGECFVEKYLHKPRHVEAQVLADQHGNVVIIGTRDCSLQRRHQKLVEEAPAPFLTAEQRHTVHEAARAICTQAGYYGAGTVEFLVSEEGFISFLEVNTRLQVEHPVTEETTGIDLVAEQFRIAAGEQISLTKDPEPRGHSIEFRINGEDPGRGFLPTPGQVTTYVEPSGPGVRVDSGVRSGSVLSGAFDSLLAKVIVTGRNRKEALSRARRALDEMRVEGVATVLPFHRAVVVDPRFTDEPFSVHTRWIESDFATSIPPYSIPSGSDTTPTLRETVVVEVNGKRLEVSLPAESMSTTRNRAPARHRERKSATSGHEEELTSPMQGTIVKLVASDGDTVAEGDVVVVLEAMKMEQPLTAHKAGTIKGLSVGIGDVVASGSVICQITE